MAEQGTRKKARQTAAAPGAAGDGVALRALANDFLDLWQANLLAWGSDPAFFPALSQLPGLPPVTSPTEKPQKRRRKNAAKKPGP